MEVELKEIPLLKDTYKCITASRITLEWVLEDKDE